MTSTCAWHPRSPAPRRGRVQPAEAVGPAYRSKRPPSRTEPHLQSIRSILTQHSCDTRCDPKPADPHEQPRGWRAAWPRVPSPAASRCIPSLPTNQHNPRGPPPSSTCPTLPEGRSPWKTPQGPLGRRGQEGFGHWKNTATFRPKPRPPRQLTTATQRALGPQDQAETPRAARFL